MTPADSPARRRIALLAVFMTAACSNGGSGNGPSPVTSAATTTGTSTTSTSTTSTSSASTVSNSYPTGLAGTVATPLSASFGSGARQIATSTSPTFDGANGTYPANASFPLIATSLQAASPGLSAAAPQDATLTVISTNANSATFQIVIPSLNVNTTLTYNTNIVQNIDGINWGYSYVNAGIWSQATSNGVLQSVTAFSSGYETPASAVPTTGSATFAGYASGEVYKPASGAISGTYVDGAANLAVNFASGQVTGALTQMQEEGRVAPTGPVPWNSVSLNASIAAGTNRFSGTTAATSAPGTGSSLSASATGHVDGAFYGPAAQNIGAVWSLSDSTGSAIGSIVAKH